MKLNAASMFLLACVISQVHAAPESALGSPAAPVTLVEYGSLTCDSCVRFHREVLPVLKRRFIDTGQVRFIFRDFPTNAAATRGAVAARCVRADAYYTMLDALFWSAPQWSRAPDVETALNEQAVRIGLGGEAFRACLRNPSSEAGIDRHRRQAAKDLDVLGTPTFVINGRIVRGAQTVKQMEALIARASGDIRIHSPKP